MFVDYFFSQHNFKAEGEVNVIVFAGLYTKGLIYINVPIADGDYIVGE